MEVSHMTSTLRLLMQIKKLKDFEELLITLLAQSGYGELGTIKKIITDKSLTGPTDIPLTSKNIEETLRESIKVYFAHTREEVLTSLLLQIGFHHSDIHMPDFELKPKRY
jgi:hypothetical protein